MKRFNNHPLKAFVITSDIASYLRMPTYVSLLLKCREALSMKTTVTL